MELTMNNKNILPISFLFLYIQLVVEEEDHSYIGTCEIKNYLQVEHEVYS